MYVHGGYGRVYTAYDFGVDLDNWIMYAYMMSFNSGDARACTCVQNTCLMYRVKGLEVPCTYTFLRSPKMIKRLVKLYTNSTV